MTHHQLGGDRPDDSQETNGQMVQRRQMERITGNVVLPIAYVNVAQRYRCNNRSYEEWVRPAAE